MKLFTIGDSISQGFMSGAAACTKLSYSTLIAEVLKIKDYHYPTWELGGQPVNIEEVFRRLQKRLGTNISGLIEWPVALNIINQYLNDVEEYYERGLGSRNFADKPYHNVSVRGFEVSSSWQITPDVCKKFINSNRSRNNWWGIVDESFLRTGLSVLTDTKINKSYSQLDWLKYHHQKEGVENLILWLGSNNALGTVLGLEIRQTSNDGSAFAKGPDKVSYEERRKNNWTLWHPDDFRVEYEYMIKKVVEIMEENPKNTDYKVFVGTVPLVTIAPIIKAVGEMNDRETIEVKEWSMDDSSQAAPKSEEELPEPKMKPYSYGKYYSYFPFADKFNINDKHLNFQQVLHIDNCIRKYNRIIQETIMNANKKLNARRFYIVDMGTVLNKMALKRNNLQPPYKYPEYFDYVYPRLDTRYYGTTRNGEIKSGGIFSLDGVHPTAIGQGLIAYEFLKVMKQAGSYNGNPEKDLNWNQIFDTDTLYTQPIGLLSEVYDNLELAKWVMKMVEKIKTDSDN